MIIYIWNLIKVCNKYEGEYERDKNLVLIVKFVLFENYILWILFIMKYIFIFFYFLRLLRKKDLWYLWVIVRGVVLRDKMLK